MLTAGLPVALVVLTGALLCWPTRPAGHRLRQLTVVAPGEPDQRRRTFHWPRPARSNALVGTIAIGVLGWLTGGFGIGLAVAAAVSTAYARWRARRTARYHLTAATGLADAVRALAAELRTGAHPASAAESVAGEVPAPAATVLHAVAGAARLGGDIGAALRRCEAELPGLASVLRPLAHAWSLAERHGLPLADLLDTAGRDLANQVRFAGQVRARMAGPRASAAVLAGLPLLGLLLGEGMGAQPVRVLLAPGGGQLLLAVGVGLACAGVRWTARLTAGPMPL